ncbi:MAG TPA: glycosyl hydrolase family 28-related protein, partial [Pyrinomonadaceae bacterium]|nr:glycosyl hydrolase family 28-related protein [Pyrinomonadaceae bacterium]
MHPLRKTLLILFLALSGSLSVAAQNVTTDDPRVNEWLNLKSYGAVGDGVADDGPALQAALGALMAAGGGTLFVPPGKFRIATTVSANFLNSATSVVIKGTGSASQLYIATGESASALELKNAESLLIDNLVFVGNPEAVTDARIVLDIQGGFKAMIRNTTFYGLISQVAGGSIVHAQGVDLRIEHSSFRGTSGAAGFQVPVVLLDGWRGLSVADVDFIDYGVLNGVYHSKTPFNPPNAWIQLNNTAPLDNALAQHEVVIERVRMDEGAYNGIFVNIDTAQSARLAHLRISGLRVNGTGLGGNGVWVQNAERVTIERSWFGYAGFPGTAVALINVDNSTLRDVRAEAAFNRIHANVGCKVLTLIDATYGTLDSQAEVLNIIRDGKYGIGRSPAEAVDVAGNVRATGQLISTAPQGTAPLSVGSSTVVPNLNADKLDGREAAEFAASNHTHDSFGPINVAGSVSAAGQLISTAPQGTAPLAVSSSALVTNFNADKLDGKDSAEFAPTTHTHTLPLGVASTFDVGDKLRVRKDDNLFGTRKFALELGRGQAIAFAGANSSAGGNYSGVLGQIGAFNAYYFSGDLL